MKVFISWSGETSREVATILKKYLKRVLQALRPWMSDTDIESGQRWSAEVAHQLAEHAVGICVLTSENQARPWLHFEAGALSKSVQTARLIPVAFGISTAQIVGPLSQFQGRMCDEAGLKQVFEDLNVLLPTPIGADELDDAFGRYWPSIAAELEVAKTTTANTETRLRSEREILEEILSIVRNVNAKPQLVPGGASNATAARLPSLSPTLGRRLAKTRSKRK